MVYQNKKPQYSYDDLLAFHERDVRECKKSILEYQAKKIDINSNQEELEQEREELLAWFYPNGIEFKRGKAHCPTCSCPLELSCLSNRTLSCLV